MTVKRVGMDGLDNLGIDEFNRLYWKGERVITETMIDFPTWVDWAIGVAVITAILNFSLNIADRMGWIRRQPPRSSEEGEQT